jgi:hypothetical protein
LKPFLKILLLLFFNSLSTYKGCKIRIAGCEGDDGKERILYPFDAVLLQGICWMFLQI